MSKIFAVLALLCAMVASAFAAETLPVMKGASSYFVNDPTPVPTGIRIDPALACVLTSAQLDQIITHNAEIPLDMHTKLVGWNNWHTHLVLEDTSTRYAAIKDSVIQSLEKNTIERREHFNPFFVLGLAYLAMLLTARVIQMRERKLDKETAFVFAILIAGTGVGSIIAVAAFLAIAAFVVAPAIPICIPIIIAMVFVSAFVVGVGIIKTDAVVVRDATVVGSIAMSTAMIGMWFI